MTCPMLPDWMIPATVALLLAAGIACAVAAAVIRWRLPQIDRALNDER